jgi:2-polyprenyl-6-methoxyphenol hydroxylase-like FAD-dependent oxidoreductase
MLIGADGTNSRVRRQRMPEAEPRDTRIRGVFGRTPVSRVDLPVLARLLANAGIMALGPRGHVFFCTAMRFREEPAAAAARLGIEGDSWPSEDYFMWAVGLRSHDRVDHRGLEMTAMHELARRAVDGFHEDCQALVRAADPNDVVVVPIRTTPPLKRSAPGRVTLIGDAVHTMPPFGAHGANTAFKDARTLAAVMGDRTRPFATADALDAYESNMRRYSRPVVKSAMRMMAFATADFPFKHAIVRTALRTARVFSR